jgi:hypothetical protein
MITHRRTASLIRLTLVLLLVGGLAGLLALAGPADASAASGQLSWWYAADAPNHYLDAITSAVPGPDGSMYADFVWGDNWGDAADMGVSRFRPQVNALDHVIWTATYDNPDFHKADYRRAMVVDAAGNVIAGGDTHTSTQGVDWVIVKWRANGTQAWTYTYDQVTHQDDYLSDVGCDRAGNVYACGITDNGGGSAYWLVMKFRASDGKRLWVHVFTGPKGTMLYNQPEAMVVDAHGNSYVTGYSDNSKGDQDLLTIKFSPRGTSYWVRRVDGAAHKNDVGTDIALRDGRVYVVGQTETAGAPGANKVMLLRYSSGGHRDWLRTWRSAAGTSPWVRGFAVDGAGNSFVAGSSLHGTPDSRAFLATWTSGGHLRWAKTYWKTTTGEAAAFYDVAADGRGRVWAAGTIGTSGSTQDALLVRYKAPGGRQWVRTFDGPEHQDDWFNTVSLWGSGSLFAGGATSTTVGDYDVLAARYTR